jgi:hypothetical protein
MKGQDDQETNQASGPHGNIIYYGISLFSKAVQFCLGLDTVMACERLKNVEY